MGIPQQCNTMEETWHKIDKLCNSFGLEDETRVLLSLAALHIHELSAAEIDAICTLLVEDNTARAVIKNKITNIGNKNPRSSDTKRYPCIMVIDEVSLLKW